MFNNYSIDRIGCADGRDHIFSESLYLLSADYTVIGIRPATTRTGPAISQGDRFFDHFPIDNRELTALRNCTNYVNEASLLFRAGDRPMLAVCACYAEANVLLIAVPENELRRLLDRPAAYDGLLDIDDRLLFSFASLARNAPQTVDGYDMLSDWIRRMHRPFFFEERVETEYDAPAAIIATRLMALARLCGCRLGYDFTALGYDYDDIHPLELILPTALSVLMAAYRTAADRSLALYAWHEADRGVCCAIRFTVLDADDPLAELDPMRALASTYQRIFMAVHDPEDPHTVFCRFMGALPDFSAQDIKNDPRDLFKNDIAAQWKVYRIPGTDGDDTEAVHQRALEELEIREIPETGISK